MPRRRAEGRENCIQCSGTGWKLVPHHDADKRALLSGICPEIKVFQYTVKSLVVRLRATADDGNHDNHSKAADLVTTPQLVEIPLDF